MPIVSTYPPDEKGPPVSTVLPIYPEEIGQNVKAPAVGKPGQKPTAKVTEPVTIPAIQTTIGELLGAETTKDEWITKEQMTTTNFEGNVDYNDNCSVKNSNRLKTKKQAEKKSTKHINEAFRFHNKRSRSHALFGFIQPNQRYAMFVQTIT